MNACMRPSLKCLSLNVNGMRNIAKRRTLFSLLRSGRWDVVALQETHHVSTQEGEDWAASGVGPLHAWPGVSYWSHGTSSSRGVALLFREACIVHEIVLRHQSPDGRVVAVDCVIDGTACTIVSVYAPVEQQNRALFFTDVLLPVLPLDRHVLLGGDFNCVSDPALDQAMAHGHGGQSHGGRARTHGYAGGLAVVEEHVGLVDVWRETHAGQAAFTHVAANAHGLSRARLDRWLVSSHFLDWCLQADIVTGLPGDHLGVSMVLSPPVSVCKGPGPWTFPLPLLHDAEFCSSLRTAIVAFFVRNDVHEGMTHAQRWDACKSFVRDFSQEYSMSASSRRRAQQRLLERTAARALSVAASSGEDGGAVPAFQAAQAALQAHHQRQAELQALRAGVAWQQYGEQSTFYFYHLANRRAKATAICDLKCGPAGESMPLTDLTSVHLARQHLSAAFSSDSPTGLFLERSTDPVAQHDLLATVTSRLLPEDRLHCEGPAGHPISVQDLSDALSAMPNGKRPGSDGLPYEFYSEFWSVLASPLCDVFQEAFAGGDQASLPESMCMGLIVLLYKDNGDRAEVSNYRPITLLNADYKLIARALASRFGPRLNSVIDPTQTAFLPGRWIADNVLCHLEEIDFLQESQQSGCIVFLDFAKAYDRLSRPWVEECMQVLGFGPQAVRCVHLLQSNTRSAVLFNGWRSDSFSVRSGLPQGSPLSPLLYVIAAQPLASALRAQAASGLFECIRLPDGTPAPPSHQHADDTTLHTLTRAGAASAVNGPVATFCAASGSSLNRAKSAGLLFGPEAAFHGVDPELQVEFKSHGGMAKHLGVYVGHEADACNDRMYDRLISGLRMRVGHWSAKRLSFLGRVHVAKQVLGASLWYHAMFVHPTASQLDLIVRIIMTFVAGGTTSAGQPRRLYPNRNVSSLDWNLGGARLLDVNAMIAALQAKLVARLLEPASLPWKLFFAQWLYRSPACLMAHPALAERPVDQLGYGLRLVFSTFALTSIGVPKRQLGYLLAFQSLRPHRMPVTEEFPLSMADVAHEPLFYNSKVADGGEPLTGQAALALARAGISTVGSLALSSIAHLPGEVHPAFHAALAAVPQDWRPALAPASQSAQVGNVRWCQHAGHAEVFAIETVPDGTVCRAYEVSFSCLLRPLDYVPVVPMAEMHDVHVLEWRPGHASDQVQGEQGGAQGSVPAQYFLVSYAGLHFSPHQWGFGSRRLPAYVVSEGCARRIAVSQMRLDSAFVPGVPIRPRIWEDDWDAAGTPALGLRACEARWQGQAGPLIGQPRPVVSSQVGVSLQRQRGATRPLPRRRAFEAAAPRRGPLPEVDADLDPLGTPDGTLAPPWAGVWGRLRAVDLDRVVRVFAWRILHMAVLCGAFRQYVRMTDQEGSVCPHVSCAGACQTMTHLFLSCPIAVQVWEWACQVWACVSGGDRPPIVASVLLADDVSVWRPCAALSTLWCRFRLSVLYALWCQAGKARRAQTPLSARSVCARIVAANRKLMSQHWFRVDMRLAELSTCPQWLSSRHPAITLAQFQEWWCPLGALCRVHVPAGSGPKLQVKWDMHHPVPLPPEPPQPDVPFEALDDVDVDLGSDLSASDVDLYD